MSATLPLDLERYPIDDLDSPAARELIERCRSRLDREGLCMLPGFLGPEAVSQPSTAGREGSERRRRTSGGIAPGSDGRLGGGETRSIRSRRLQGPHAPATDHPWRRARHVRSTVIRTRAIGSVGTGRSRTAPAASRKLRRRYPVTATGSSSRFVPRPLTVRGSTRWAFPDDPGPRGLTVQQSYFDRTPYVEVDDNGTTTYVDTNAPGSGPFFYRVFVDP